MGHYPRPPRVEERPICRTRPWRARLALFVLPPIVALVAGIACDGSQEPQIVATVVVSPSSAELLALGETLQLIATARDENGQTIEGAVVNWASNDNSVATVDGSGVVTAVQNGNATVTATSGSAAGTASITVAQRLVRIDLSPSADTLFSIGDTVRLTAQPVDANSNPVPDIAILWNSADDSVAIVDSNGLVTATGSGRANITATGGGVSGAATISVSQILVSMDVLPSSTTLLSLGDTVRLSAVGLDANGHAVAGLFFTWISKNDAVAAVDSMGLVSAVRTGSTDVFASSGELRDSAGVTVAQLAAEVLVTPAVDTLHAVGDTVRLSASARDANGHLVEDTDYVWTTRDSSVVTVDGMGLVTAEGPGTGEIEVKATRAGVNRIAIATITVLEIGTGSASAGGARSAQPGRRLPLLPAARPIAPDPLRSEGAVPPTPPPSTHPRAR